MLKPLAEWPGAQRAKGYTQVNEHILGQIKRRQARAERQVAIATASHALPRTCSGEMVSDRSVGARGSRRHGRRHHDTTNRCLCAAAGTTEPSRRLVASRL